MAPSLPLAQTSTSRQVIIDKLVVYVYSVCECECVSATQREKRLTEITIR
jgi:hypothetical protein